MKAALITLIVLSWSLSAFAQFNSSLPYTKDNHAQLSPLHLLPSKEVIYVDVAPLPPGYRMKNVGGTLTLAGSFLVIGGLIFYSGSDKTATNYGNKVIDPEAILGTYMIVGGVGMIVPGVIFWAKGTKKYKRFLAEEANSTASISMNGRGVRIVYRF